MDDNDRFEAQTGFPSSYMARKRLLLPDRNGDPMMAIGNFFNLAVLVGVGLMVMALTSIGLGDYFSDKTLTIVKNPGDPAMEIITKELTKQGPQVTRLKLTGKEGEGAGTVIGTVYQLQDGQIVWVPPTTTAPTAPTPTTPTTTTTTTTTP